MSEAFDVAVVGGGAVGLAAAWVAAAEGRSVVVLERDRLFHDRGSSGGAQRQWRVQYDNEALARLVLAAAPRWQRVEEAIDRPLVHRTGSVWFGDVERESNEGQIRAAVAVLDRLSVPYEWLGAADIEKRFGFRHLPERYEGFYQPDGGMIDVRATLWSLATLAQQHGAHLRDRSAVLDVRPAGTGVTVTTADGTVEARAAVITAGAGTRALLDRLGVEVRDRLFEMPSAYFRLRDPAVDYPTWFAFEPPTADDSSCYYGFGRNPWGHRDLVRVAPDTEAHPLADAAQATGVVREDELRRLSAWVAAHLPALDPAPVEPSTCLVVLPERHDQAFHVGQAPGAPQISYCAAGWIFKYVPLLGEVCVDLALRGAAAADVAELLPRS